MLLSFHIYVWALLFVCFPSFASLALILHRCYCLHLPHCYAWEFFCSRESSFVCRNSGSFACFASECGYWHRKRLSLVLASLILSQSCFPDLRHALSAPVFTLKTGGSIPTALHCRCAQNTASCAHLLANCRFNANMHRPSSNGLEIHLLKATQGNVVKFHLSEFKQFH